MIKSFKISITLQIIQNVVDQMEENLASAKAKTNGYLNACDPNESGHIGFKILRNLFRVHKYDLFRCKISIVSH